jgi:ATP-binding cassette, subfamily B, putative efflux pump
MARRKSKKAANFKIGIFTVWELLEPHRRRIFLITFFGLIVAVTGAFVPFIIGKFLDSLTTAAQSQSLADVKIAFLMLFVWFAIQGVNQFIGFVNQYISREVPELFQFTVHEKAISHLLRLPMSFHKQTRMSEIREIVGRAANMISSVILDVSDTTVSLLSVGIGIAIAFSINTQLALLLLLGALVYVVVMVRTVRASAYLHREGIDAWSRAMGRAHTPVHYVDSIKAFASEAYEDSQVKKSFNRAIEKWMRMENVWTKVDAFQRAVVYIVQGSIFVSSVFLIFRGDLTIGGLVAFNGYSAMFLGPLVRIGFTWHRIQNGLSSAAALKERILMAKTEVYEPENAEPIIEMIGNVKFDNVSFKYDDGDTSVLRNISFEARSGEIVAFVGESGGGKSTIISLILAMYFPTSGKILIDGKDSRRLNLNDFRSQVAVVPQEVALFNDTVEKNIKYGTFTAASKKIQDAAKIAQADEFIKSLPRGYKTLVGERGVKLSVGQKQRVAVARAVLRDPRILILDEPTSALDSKTEHDLTQALEKLMQGRTTFIIAHRLSTVRKADKIVVLEKGRVAEIGSHDELVKKRDSVYKRLYEQHIGLRE